MYVLMLLATMIAPHGAPILISSTVPYESKAECEHAKETLAPFADDMLKKILPSEIKFENPHFECYPEGKPI